MNLIKISSIALTAFIIVACSSLKKNTTSTAPTTPAPTATARPANGVFVPGNEELTAIQAKYKDVTMQTLIDGHAIYTGVCTNCHGAKSIYSRPEEIWPNIIDHMAPKAKITDAQKDAVYKYVLAIKATQPKESR